jgi:gliding motility-associated lipoprotein GldH
MFEKKINTFLGLIFALSLLSSCQTIELYEQSTIYPNHQWDAKQVNEYQFSIDDTTSSYNVYFVIRHHNAYSYKNIWIQLNTTAPDRKISKESFDLNLADDVKGWLGTGMDDIYDQRIPIYPAPVHFKKGVYKFAITHTMRADPLPNILSTGIRVEKAKQ